jgi:hypothetical protein
VTSLLPAVSALISSLLPSVQEALARWFKAG